MNIYQKAILKEYFKLRVKEFEDFYNFMEINIIKHEDKYKKRFNQWTKNLSAEQKTELEDIYADDIAMLDYHRQILYRSFLITIFAFFEGALNTICRNIEKIKHDVVINLSDIKGMGIERAKIYLRKIAGCPASLFAAVAWQEIKILQDIRNIFVHNEGKFSEGDGRDKIENYCKKKPEFFLYIENDNFPARKIIVKRKFCTYSLENIEKFLNQLLKNVSL